MKPIPQGVLAVDPGTKAVGWAVLSGYPRRLTSCGFVPVDVFPDCWYPSELVIEVPQVYPQRAWKGDPNDLIDVALAAGIVIGRVHCTKVRTPRPHQWKGTCPKEIHQRRVLALLDMSERAILEGCGAPKSKLHNVVDAIGLGLWAAGRLKR